MNYFVEIRAGVRRTSPPRLVPLDEVSSHRGFRSVFAFDTETAQFIQDVGSTSNLRGRPVYTDVLLMDFDNGDPTEFREWLRSSGLQFETYDSGGRSIHCHIAMEPVYGGWVPAACKRWVQQNSKNADISFYHPAGMFRLPGTFHAKHAGHCKHLIEEGGDTKLVLTEPPAREIRPIESSGHREDFFLLLLEHKEPGGRQPFMWRLGVTAAQAGMEFQEALENMLWWNQQQSQPHPDQIVERQCLSAYQQLARRA